MLTTIKDGSRLAAGGLRDFAMGLAQPVLRLGVTGLSRSGKTVFITALVHAMTKGAGLPLLSAGAGGRVMRAYLEPQPDHDLPRFPYEANLQCLAAQRHWPQSTDRASQLRLTIDYEPGSALARARHGGKLHVDIIDYPGEWLLDLPLMQMSYAQWSNSTIAASHTAPRSDHSGPWLNHLAGLDAVSPADELAAVQAADIFTAYLKACRADHVSLSGLPPGRFLMPGDLQGSPLLTFAPLNVETDRVYDKSSLAWLMEQRYQAYVSHIVRPFFFDRFARLDRQIVLVDVLQALNAGSAAVTDLKDALTAVLSCFRQGRNNLTSMLFGRRIDKILFAATKADQLHQDSHDRLEAILRLVTEDAARRAGSSGTEIGTVAMAAIRATREAVVEMKGKKLSCIVGLPQAGEMIDGHLFDGETDAAVFPGDLPVDAASALNDGLKGKLRFVRFRPPLPQEHLFPSTRLSRAIDFLIGDRLQ